MFYRDDRLALFIDGSNLYAAAKSLGFDIDYKLLRAEFMRRGKLVRAFYYTALLENDEYSPIRPLVDWLNYNGFTMRTKPAKEYTDSPRPPEGQGQHGRGALRRRAGARRPSSTMRALLGRRRLQAAGRGAPAQGRARLGLLRPSAAAAHDLGRPAAGRPDNFIDLEDLSDGRRPPPREPRPEGVPSAALAARAGPGLYAAPAGPVPRRGVK
jgi:hypothetical protein